MPFRLIYCLLFITLSPLCNASDAMRELNSLQEGDFIGALSNKDIKLATRLAKELEQLLPGKQSQCGAYDSMQGSIIGLNSAKNNPSLDDLLLEADPPFYPLLKTIIKGNHRQSAIALYTIGLAGPKAAKTIPFIQQLFNKKIPWSATALSSISCENYQTISLVQFEKTLAINLDFELRTCSEKDITKVFSLAIQPNLIWPEESIERSISDMHDLCRNKIMFVLPSTDQINQLKTFLKNSNVAANRKIEALSIIELTWPKLAKVLTDSSRALLQNKNTKLRDAAERMMVMSGTEEGLKIFIRWLSQGYNPFYWSHFVNYLTDHPEAIRDAMKLQLNSKQWNQRLAAVKTLQKFGTEKSVAILAQSISPSDWVTTEAIIEALAPLIEYNLLARATLQDVADNYWSPRVSEKAKLALQPATIKARIEKNKIITIGYKDEKHGLPRCDIDKTNFWIFPDGSKRRIDWVVPTRKKPPRGEFNDVSKWCSTIGDFVTHPYENGWLAGCLGFEASGGLAFIPDNSSVPIKSLAPISTTGILEFKKEFYITGIDWFLTNGKVAGQLFKIIGHGKSLQIYPVMLLPAVSDAVAVMEDYMIFDDHFSTVAVDSNLNIYPLSCE